MRHRPIRLLIVPYGIETTLLQRNQHAHFLLIVPYGIETDLTSLGETNNDAFNCTLWN